jgi:O-antigen/teichoic acid export membrane protein
VTQFVSAGASLVLQVFVARWLGASALGSYAIFLSLLVTINALQSGWLGDSLTVLDRHDPAIRGALVASALAICALSAVIGGGFALGFGVGDGRVGALCAAATMLWCAEETGRRILMARLEFWKLVVNDSAYALGAVAFVLLVVAVAELTLAWVIVAMAVGSLVAITVGLFQIPSAEWKPGTRERASRGMGTLAGFAAWRAGQAGLRPLGLLVLRLAIVLFASRAVLGEIEAARLLMAPTITLVAGAGLFLLPVYVRNERLGGDARHRNPPQHAALLLATATAAYGLLAVAFVAPMTQLVTSGSVEPSRVAVLAWIVWTIGYAIGVPYGNLGVARQLSRGVFVIRVVDTLVGFVLVVALLQLSSDDVAPIGAGVGMLVGAYLLARLLRHQTTEEPTLEAEPKSTRKTAANQKSTRKKETKVEATQEAEPESTSKGAAPTPALKTAAKPKSTRKSAAKPTRKAAAQKSTRKTEAQPKSTRKAKGEAASTARAKTQAKPARRGTAAEPKSARKAAAEPKSTRRTAAPPKSTGRDESRPA